MHWLAFFVATIAALCGVSEHGFIGVALVATGAVLASCVSWQALRPAKAPIH